MKYILALTLLVITTSIVFANQEEFKLRIDEENIVEIDKSNWTHLSDEKTYHFYVSKFNNQTQDGYYRMHSMVEFKEENGKQYTNLEAPVKRVISFGFMQCQEGVFYLIGELYTDKNNKIIYSAKYEFGEFVAEVTAPNTARNKAFMKVCIGGRDA